VPRGQLDTDVGTALRCAAVLVLGVLLGVLLLEGVYAGNQVAALLLIGSIVPVAALPAKRIPLALAVLLLAWLGVHAVMEVVPEIVDLPPTVSTAVGEAAYTGVSYQTAQLALAVTMALVVAGAIAAAVIGRRRGSTPGEAAEPFERPCERRSPPWPLIAVAAAIALTLAPSLATTLGPWPILPGQPNAWDTANFDTWNVLLHRGLAPMHDFFYPYGGQWLFELVPLGPLLRWLAYSALLGLAAWTLWRLSGRRALPVAACLLALVLIGTWQGALTQAYVPGAFEPLWRYLPGLLIPLVYAAIGPARRPRLDREHLLFGATCLLAGLLEADLLVYGAAGAIMVLLGELVGGTLAWRWRELLRRVAIDLAAPLAAALLLVGYWVLSGTFEGNFRFFGDLQAFSAASAINPYLYVLSGYTLKPTGATVAVAVPALLAAAGFAYGILARRLPREVGALLLAAAGVSFVFDRRRLAVVALAAILAGAALSTLPGSGTEHAYTSYAKSVIHTPGRVADVLALPFDEGEQDRYSPETLRVAEYSGDIGSTAGRAFRSFLGGAGAEVPSFAALGNVQLMYAFFDQGPPYQVDPYAASPIAEQEAVVERLEETDPRYMVWVDDGVYLDNVPYPVRDPLIYGYMVERYVPVKIEGAVRILRLRQPGEPIATRFWQATLGTSDLAFVPTLSSGVDAPSCGGGSGCHDYVILEGPEPQEVAVLGVRFAGRGGEFEVSLRSKPGQTRYAVRIDRLWFAPLLGPDPTVSADAPADWSARVEGRKTGEDLY
jgi:hypothetical protein